MCMPLHDDPVNYLPGFGHFDFKLLSGSLLMYEEGGIVLMGEKLLQVLL